MSKTLPFDFDVSRYPRLNQARGLFVVGTDTAVGKTLVAGAIARSLRNQGRKVAVFKPVATGCNRRREGLVSEDAMFLAACADSSQSLIDVTPLRYHAAISPNVAAERERRPVDLPAMFEAYNRAVTAGDTLIVEGVGGLLCPLSDDFWVIHLARLARLPVVIVARAGLGTINHTLLTLHTARSAGLAVAGVVINGYEIEPTLHQAMAAEAPGSLPAHGDAELAMFTNPAQIAARGKVRVLAVVPREAGNSVEKITVGPDTQYAIDQVEWDELMET